MTRRAAGVAPPIEGIMFCRQCGTQNDPSSLFCAKCGVAMSAPTARFENGPVVPAAAVPASPRISPTPPVPAPIPPVVAPISTTSRIARGAYGVLRETGWVLWEVCVCSGRGAGSIWSFARQRRLKAKRGRVLEAIGEELRQTAVPKSLEALLKECERQEAEIKRHSDALAAQTPRAGWFSRFGLRTRLSRAQSARRAALRKLGEGGISLVPPARQEPVRAMEAAITGEQTRRTRLWEPWRALTLPRRMEISVVAISLLGAAIILASHFTKTSLVARLPKSTSSEPELKDQRETAARKAQVDKEKSRKLPGEFAQQRKALPPGQLLLYSGNPVLLPGELDEWDDFKVGSPVVLKEGDRYRMWYRGCHFLGLEYTCGVGHATSTDGVSWEKSLKPVFVPQDAHECERLDSLALVRAGDYYWMWYSVRADQFANHPYVTIHLATSKDGLSWQPAGAVLRALSQWTLALEPSAFYDGKLFHLWYADFPSSDEDRTLIHLTSANGTQWQTAGATSLKSLHAPQPGKLSVLPDGRGGYRALFPYLRYEYGEAGIFGMLLSDDGNLWRLAHAETKVPREKVIRDDFGPVVAYAPAVLAGRDGLSVWFGFLPENGAEQIRLAFLKE
jgi:hypothetical protein